MPLHGARFHERATTGPLVADIFVGPYPRTVHRVLRLQRVVRLPVRRRAAKAREDELKFRRPFRPTLPAVPPRGIVLREFEEALAADADRLQHLSRRALAARLTERAQLRVELAAAVPPAAFLHERVRRSALSPARRVPRIRSVPAARRAVQERQHALPAAARRRRRSLRGLLAEPVRIALGTLAVLGVVAFLASLGDLPRVARQVETEAGEGTAALKRGFRSLLAADTRASTDGFAKARAAYQGAIQKLQDSTSILQRFAGNLDPKERLASAEVLLVIGERTAALGAEASAVLDLLQHPKAGTLVDALGEARPGVERLARGLGALESNLLRLRPEELPADVEQTVAPLKESVGILRRGVQEFLALDAVIRELLGARHDRQYLVMFQNNRELRPTGGFIGSFALVDISRGAVRKVHVDTIYNPDGQLKDFLVPPRPLQKITDRWYARDANWFADFRTSATKVATLFERSGGPTVDGVLAVTPTVLEDLLRLTGPIALPAYDVTITAENVTDELQRLVTYEYDRERNEPKAFLADLVPVVLARVTELPKERWGDLLGVFTDALTRKHLLVFFRNEEAEGALVKLGWAGALPALPPPTPTSFTDHLGRVEANIGGHKTDFLVEQTVAYDVNLSRDGALTGTLVVTRHHRGSKTGTLGADSAEDPRRKRNIVFERTFVPAGSELLEARGFTPDGEVPSALTNTADYATFTRDTEVAALEAGSTVAPSGVVIGQESGMTTFGGFVITGPEETTVTVLRYRLPFRVPSPSLLASLIRYELLLTHQPGHQPVITRATLQTPEGFRIAWSGPETAVTRSGDRKVDFEALVDRDRTWGAVLEEE